MDGRAYYTQQPTPAGGVYPPPGYPPPYTQQPGGYPPQTQPQYPGYPQPQPGAYPPHHGHYPPPPPQGQQQPQGTHTVIITQPAAQPVYADGYNRKRRRSKDSMDGSACCAGLCAGMACCCLLDACEDMDFGD